MAEFKSSKLIERLANENHLSEDAWDFVDADMDDFVVDEYDDGNTIEYELRGTLMGYHNGEFTKVYQTYWGDINGMAALIEHLALVDELLLQSNGW